MQLLLDINSMPQIPQSIRYDLQGFEDRDPSKFEEYDRDTGHRALRKGRYDVQRGTITQHEYEDLRQTVLQSSAFQPDNSYASLAKDLAEQTTRVADTISDAPDFKSGFLTITQEDQYQRAMDDFLRGEALTPRGHVNGHAKDGERNLDKDKEIQLRNPVSVYNYLRKHEPKVFLQDEDAKPSRTTGNRASKRSSNRDSILKQEQELYDEDGIAVEATGGRSKRKRDEDGGYRPKGGAARKRKRDSEAGVWRSRKKASIG